VATSGQDFGRRENDLTIKLLQAVTIPFARLYHGLQVKSSCQLPSHGPAILVCNHTSSLDPVLIQAVCPRLIRWMMAKEYFEVRPLRFFFKAVGVILVDRGQRDMAATRAAMRALADGYVLGIFPEGRIETDGELLPFHPGTGLMALRSGAPVYPAYLTGNQRGREMLEAFWRPANASLSFGPPIDLTAVEATRQGVRVATERIRSSVASLKAFNDKLLHESSRQ
jgi:1-acyl-sn-glycerol-3-phosphate acyltransferase